MSAAISPGLINFLRSEFRLDWRGIHGAGHWARVRYNGLCLARRTGANTRVVELFSFVHDARRVHDGGDRRHGERAAELVHELQGRLFCLGRTELGLLELACREHSAGRLDADATVQTCWDADRLDLGRVGIRPDPARLCTEAAKEPGVIADAYERSLGCQPLWLADEGGEMLST
jgi:uncharacterized protein